MGAHWQYQSKNHQTAFVKTKTRNPVNSHQNSKAMCELPLSDTEPSPVILS